MYSIQWLGYGWTTKTSWFDSQQEERHFSLAKLFRRAQEANWPNHLISTARSFRVEPYHHSCTRLQRLYGKKYNFLATKFIYTFYTTRLCNFKQHSVINKNCCCSVLNKIMKHQNSYVKKKSSTAFHPIVIPSNLTVTCIFRNSSR